MKTSRVYLIFKIFIVFIAVLIAEYFFCGIYFRLVKHSNFLWVDLICGLSAISLCYLIFKRLIKSALKEKIPFLAVAAFFLFFCVLLGFFLRFSLQLANGLLDTSEPETRVVYVVDKKISSFGGSIKDGPNPMAHLIYFHDWDNSDKNCELLISPVFYYNVGLGTRLAITLRRGFFHLPWVEDCQLVNPRLNGA